MKTDRLLSHDIYRGLFKIVRGFFAVGQFAVRKNVTFG